MEDGRSTGVRVQAVTVLITARQRPPKIARRGTTVARNGDNLDAMTRGEDQQLRDAGRNPTSERGRCSSQTAANVDGRRPMTRADDQDLHF